jgi:phosphoribosylformylglycinamidine synthase
MDEFTKLDLSEIPLDRDWNETLLALLAAPNICSKHWVYDQYDSTVRTSTAVGPGSDAAVIRIRKTTKALAMSTDCNGRYCYINPRLGAQSAVAEAARNIVCSGGKPLAVTNCLNFGNPYKPEIYYGFSEAVAGMGEACSVFDTPVTGGNVSFYNEDPMRAVFPSPVIGMVGLIADVKTITTQWFKDEGDIVFLLGTNHEHLGASEYLHTIFEKTRGTVPPLDLQFERRLQDGLLAAIEKGVIKSAHDCSEGGLAVALAECCITNEENMIGANVSLDDNLRPDCLLFGESQSRIVISCAPETADAVAGHFANLDIPCAKIGTVGGDKLSIDGYIDQPLAGLHDAFYNAMPSFMEHIGDS